MNTKLAAALMGLVLTATGVWAAETKATEEETTILTLALKRSYPDGGYTVVHPETRFWPMIENDPKEIKESKKDIATELRTNGIAVTKLVGRLFDRNKRVAQLSIKSSPKDGYVIDSEGTYGKYFEKGGGGWKRWHEENPKAHGMTTVSLPVYDQKTGLVLVYMDGRSDGRAGAGWVFLYRYEKGELKELTRVMLWIS